MVKKIIQTIGKRKSAIAKATLSAGKGVVRINHQLLDSIKPELLKQRLMEPLLLSDDNWQKVDINVIVNGGGVQGQTEAARLAIARALVEFNKKLKKPFLDYDRHLLIADVRFKETRKPNDSKARSARQKSYR
ncbi:30S ribosomal protein S9 [Candidatus Woesearchaeota archaeon]|nr:30S ribosomal protein S9 [Candidatus Woesearchaeota archaeon]